MPLSLKLDKNFQMKNYPTTGIWILQQIIPGTPTFDKVETSNIFKYSVQSFTCTNFQGGNSYSIRKSI